MKSASNAHLSLNEQSLPKSLKIVYQSLASQLTRQEQAQLIKLLNSSNFAANLLAAKPKLLNFLLEEAQLEDELNQQEYNSWCLSLLPASQQIASEEDLHLALRLVRQKAMLRLLWRDAQTAGDYQQMWKTAAEISYLAQVLINFSLDWLENHFAAGWGRAYSTDANPQAQRLEVLALGKLGAGELNLSSDIDLIFTFPSSQGETQGGRRSLAKDDYFIRLGQKLITALDKPTAEGRVFRVDMRLRPYGNAGALALSHSALLNYYQHQGRDWERYALIKAAAMTASDTASTQQLLADLQPFIYRRYLDFSALEALRDLKEKINQEVQQQAMQDNIKLGRGGIREVEFICQVFQLIRGGRATQLQSTSIREVLPLLSKLGLLPAEASEQLFIAYTFLRDLENALQAMDDQQTHDLPTCPEIQQRLARRLGKNCWSEVLSLLEDYRQNIRQEFNALIATPYAADEANQTATPLINPVNLSSPKLTQDLTQLGYQEPETASQLIQNFLASKGVARMQPLGHKRLEELLPFLLTAASKTAQPCLALERSLWLIEAVLRRTAYLVLLKENPPALEQLVTLGAASPWVAELLAKMPILLDELLNPQELYAQLTKPSLEKDLAQQLIHLSWQDTEAQMEALRYFRHANLLRLATADLLANRPLMQVSDSLTFMAEVALQQVLTLAWQDLAARHGLPKLADGTEASLSQLGFVILGYGKLGGLELSYASDLDLVFLHLGHPSLPSTGARPLDSASWFSRLGQRIIHYLTTTTVSGQLYEVDMRLRPSGQSGLLVTSLEAFSSYQESQAWTWEHQALVRARAVAGDAALAAQFTQVRSSVLSQCRGKQSLQADVLAMREKLLTENATATNEGFCFKQAKGGILDIEFLVQFMVLAFSADYPAIHQYSDVMRQLDSLAACELLTQEEAKFLQTTFLEYRQALHQSALAKTVPVGELSRWQATADRVHSLFLKYVGV